VGFVDGEEVAVTLAGAVRLIVDPDDDELVRVAERIGGTEVRDPAGNPLVLATANRQHDSVACASVPE
jgi:hypothetical protein